MPQPAPTPRSTAIGPPHAERRETVASYVLKRLNSLALTQAQLCKRAGMSRQTLHSLLHAPHKLPALQTVFALASGLNVHPIKLLQLLCDDQIRRFGAPPPRLRGDRTAYVRDATYPDGELVLPGQRFTKIWEIQNVGTVAWRDRYLQCMDEEIVVYARSGETLRIAQTLEPVVQRVPLAPTPPGGVVQVAVEFIAPLVAGTVLSYWKMAFEDGRLCFPKTHGVWAKVHVTSLSGLDGDD